MKEANQDTGELPRPTRMLRLEQQIGYVMAGVSLATSVTLGARLHNTLLTVAGVLGTIVFLIAVRRGHRIFTALAGFLCALAISTYFPIEIAMLIYSGYLMMRTSNAQGKLRRSQPQMSRAERQEANAARIAAKRVSRNKRAAQPAPVSNKPPANSRYTPPKPKPVRRSEPTKAVKAEKDDKTEKSDKMKSDKMKSDKIGMSDRITKAIRKVRESETDG